MIYAQNELGACLVVAGMIFIMMFCAGVNLRYIIGLIIIVLVGALVAVFGTHFRMGRITSWLDPWSDPLDGGFQIIQSWFAIGSGGLTGMAWGLGAPNGSICPPAIQTLSSRCWQRSWAFWARPLSCCCSL